MLWTRRNFLYIPAAAGLLGAEGQKTRIGLVRSDHGRLARRASPEDPLDYEIVRDMVWRATGRRRPAASKRRSGRARGWW
jgi:hypothetical protein